MKNAILQSTILLYAMAPKNKFVTLASCFSVYWYPLLQIGQRDKTSVRFIHYLKARLFSQVLIKMKKKRSGLKLWEISLQNFTKTFYGRILFRSVVS